MHETQHCHPALQRGLAVVAVNLQILIILARRELAGVQEEILEEIRHRIAQKAWQSVTSPLLFFPSGTIPSCPQCEKERSQRGVQEAQKVQSRLQRGCLQGPFSHVRSVRRDSTTSRPVRVSTISCWMTACSYDPSIPLFPSVTPGVH